MHGRGVFFTENGAPTFLQGTVASVLAVFGLVIEAALIATITQRFFWTVTTSSFSLKCWAGSHNAQTRNPLPRFSA